MSGIAGVWLDDVDGERGKATLTFVVCEHEHIASGDRIACRIDGELRSGTIAVAPRQVLQADVTSRGEAVPLPTDTAESLPERTVLALDITGPHMRVGRVCEDSDLSRLPGDGFPVLGSRFDAGGIEGEVVRLDVPGRRATIRRDNGEEVVMPVDGV